MMRAEATDQRDRALPFFRPVPKPRYQVIGMIGGDSHGGSANGIAALAYHLQRTADGPSPQTFNGVAQAARMMRRHDDALRICLAHG